MVNARKIGVLVLTTVFFLCVPFHALEHTHSINSHQHHAADENLIRDAFSHTGEMARALAFVGVLLFAVLVAYCFGEQLVFAERRIQFAISAQSPRCTTSGVRRWLRMHTASPPFQTM